MSKNLLVSFSGGKTSAYMAYMVKTHLEQTYDKVLYIFANTSREHPKTLDFVNKVDLAFGLGVVWVEACVQEGRKGTTYRTTNFSNAKRDGSVFEDVIKKYGIPNQSYPHCTRELKLSPIHKYAKEYFDGEKYEVAIGIRSDEIRRVSKKASEMYGGVIYPLIDLWPSDKEDVNNFWDGMSFTLDIPEHYGNCMTCFKKSNRKLFTMLEENPDWFDFERKMEDRYSSVKAPDTPRKFFRGHRSVDDLIKLKDITNFDRFTDGRFNDLDKDGGCSESCELYATEY